MSREVSRVKSQSSLCSSPKNNLSLLFTSLFKDIDNMQKYRGATFQQPMNLRSALRDSFVSYHATDALLFLLLLLVQGKHNEYNQLGREIGKENIQISSRSKKKG
jgi:hypothetical protein